MFLFMMILLPAVIIYECIRAEDKTVVLTVAAGAAAGILVCAVIAFSFYMHRVPAYSFGSNFVFYALKEVIVPIAAVYIVYFFVTKDPVEFRVKAFFPLIASFYAVYMPYFIIASTGSAYSFFELFMKPVIVLSMITLSAHAVYGIYSAAGSSGKKKTVLYAVVLAAALLVPPCISSLWLMKLLMPVVMIASAVYIASAAVCFAAAVRRRTGFLF